MNGKVIKKGYTFDDLLLIPAYSEVVPSMVDVTTRLTSNITLKTPILSAAMDTVTESKMAIALARLGGLGIIHKNLSPEKQAELIKEVKTANSDSEQATLDDKKRLMVGAALGVNEDTLSRLEYLVKAGVDIVCVDSAHGHSLGVINTIKKIREAYPSLDIIGGNIVTKEAALDLISAGANVLKVGVGPGSICTTRVIAGVGLPQISAVYEVYEVAKERGVSVIADGGIKLSGDIVKAIAAGASAVMLGGLLAGSEEAPGETFELNGKKVKVYMGMGSLTAMQKGSSDRYFQGGVKELKKLVPEGIEATVAYKGYIKDVIHQMMGGLRSGMGYCGCKTILELQTKAKFVEITGAGLKESHPHDVENIKEAPNYVR